MSTPPEPFCAMPTDEELVRHYATLDDLINDFVPGNYTPTQAQARQLIRVAALAAVRWVELKARPTS